MHHPLQVYAEPQDMQTNPIPELRASALSLHRLAMALEESMDTSPAALRFSREGLRADPSPQHRAVVIESLEEVADFFSICMTKIEDMHQRFREAAVNTSK